ncbi:hypothetical protein MNBD_GAMMA22-756 [hydrothermal vent metagenome]|uniref:Succinate dehydrogenase hydrophobic membrane anchor protein n=1 Tax=hydrothermal vent metagenome TaxID=652676 RepID=A0A3B0ZPC5_9ZZZZ
MSQYAHGFRAWIVQRLSALYLLLFSVISIVWFFNSPKISFEFWITTFQSPLTIILVALFFIAVFIHAWVGIRDIIIDYINPYIIRLTVLVLILLFLFALGAWVVLILISVYVR